ncbi:3-phenylpropionate/cinnamic acid dioxygenase subunit beta [Amycolatopsis sp. ATCC 39116]|uniref:3-phenylpropionate/cinnamic acid dioxygenase subunit beta n=1 Tax=Amycolatopsis sp. (strain ATCC 39116 / 75iv2) TaxID=385957 RepID=UPI00193094C8|nr:3-phenylpropionate/cinnamic acid dioxygenase subunit beta [Amycolatopsis sp. ATCC 39116]
MSSAVGGAESAEQVHGRSRMSLKLQHEIEQFYYYEAELLDDRRYRVWYDLLAEDIRYWMPIRYNRVSRELDQENSGPGMLATIEDDKESIGWKVRQFETGTHWSEDPPSRTRHLISNVRIRPGEREGEVAVRSNFLCYRNRLDTEVDMWVGQREDVLRSTGEERFLLARRTILLDQNVILSKNVTVFF